MENKKEILGQYFTKKEVVNKLIDLLLAYKNFDKDIKILEPSFGTGNFISVLEEKAFVKIEGCEIDANLTDKSQDFFELSLKNKYDLIIGNPPFTKYNLAESYYKPKYYIKKNLKPWSYLPAKETKSNKMKIENAFLYKGINHLIDKKDSTIAFVLPISFFIKNRNVKLKSDLIKRFKTIIIYQNDQIWFDYKIPCCFAILTNIENLQEKIILKYENHELYEHKLELSDIYEEIIPEVVKNKINSEIFNSNETPLNYFLIDNKVSINKSYTNNNVSAKNILEKTVIPDNKNIDEYKLAVVRVGNSSVGKTGLINYREDILNDMFFIFDLKDEYKFDKSVKENICKHLNINSDYFKKITSRVGSKSIKKEDVYNFKINL